MRWSGSGRATPSPGSERGKWAASRSRGGALIGPADTTVKIEQSKWLAAAPTKAGVAHQFRIIPDAPPPFDLPPKQRDLRPVVLGFLAKHLKSPNQPSSTEK